MSSVLSGGYISESQTDFIFTIIGEEFGFIGACSVILLILGIAIDCLIIASRANDLGGKLIPTGMAVWIGFQGFLNIGVARGYAQYRYSASLCVFGTYFTLVHIRGYRMRAECANAAG